jgi:hypothetical protein
MGTRDFFFCELSETIRSVYAFFTLVVLTPKQGVPPRSALAAPPIYAPRVSSICG